MPAKNPVVAVIVILICEAFLGLPLARGQTFESLHAFTFTIDPKGALARDSAGSLYGTTVYGGHLSSCCGAVWKASPNGSTWKVSLIHEFNGPDGEFPNGGVIIDSSGNLYGTAGMGGIVTPWLGCGGGCGTVFELLPNSKGGWNFKVLHEFTGIDGYGPESKLTLDSAGNLYGTTGGGGTSTGCNDSGCGTVFKLSKNSDGSWAESVLYSFNGGDDGSLPGAGVTFDSAGNLYGTTILGGQFHQYGTVYKLAPGSGGTWTESILHSFTDGADGAQPYSDLAIDAAGDLYGTTLYGGATPVAGGVVFKLTSNGDGTWSEIPIHTFSDTAFGSDGTEPIVGVTFDSAGNLYGATDGGGGKGVGVVYKLTPGGGEWSETILHDFWGYGTGPMGTILIDPAGHLFGTTIAGKYNEGTLFEIIP